MLHTSWLHESVDHEMQAYEHIALQYYYLGMIEKSSNYHKRTIRGVDINDRPKGFEPSKTKGRGLEAVAIGKKVNEFYETTSDGQTKVLIQEDKDYAKVSDRIQEYASNLW